MKPYDTYKDSGIEWIGAIPGHWEVRRGDSLFSLKKKLKRKDDLNGLEIYHYSIPSVQEFGQAIIEDGSTIDSDKFEVSGNEILFSKLNPRKGTVVLSSIHNKLAVASTEFVILEPKTDHIVFCFYYLSSDGFKSYISSLVESATKSHQRANPTDIYKAKFALPSIEEQTAIATYLNLKTAEIDALIADKKSLLGLYEEEKATIINQAVTKGIDPKAKMKDSGVEWLGEIPEHWEVKRFKYFFHLITEKKENDLLKIGLENIESKTGKFIKTDTEFEGQGISFKLKDILFGKLRPYLAKAWLSEFEGQAVGDFYVFRAKENVLPEFAKYRILDSSFIAIVNSSTYGSKMPRVSWEFISDLFIAFPNSKEQQSIVRHIETECTRIDAKIAKTQKLIELLTEYRTALISEVVTGKIKVID